VRRLVWFGDGESESLFPGCREVANLDASVEDGAEEGCDDVGCLVQAFVGDAIQARG